MAKVKLGNKASVFHDPSTGLTVHKGEVVELNNKQMLSKRIRSAINGGHLVYAVSEKEEEKVAVNVEAVKEKFLELVGAGKESNKIAKAFNIDQLKALARSYDIEPEENDTKEILVVAIMEEVAESAGNEDQEDQDQE